MKKKEFPDTIVLLFFIMIFVLILTWIVPAGQFERVQVDNRTVVVPDSFEYIEQSPQGIFSLFTSLPKAFEETQNIVFFIFIVGGVFYIIQESGVLVYWITKVINVFKDKEIVVIPVTVLILGLAGTTIGLKEETLMLVPIGIALAIALGFDALTGVAIISLGAAFGFYTSVVNPFSVGIAQEIAEVPLYSGIGLRIVLFIVYWIITSLYIVRYAKKVKNNPEESLVSEIDYSSFNEIEEIKVYDKKQIYLITASIVFTFVAMLYGVFSEGWFILEIGAIFLVLALVVGILSRTTLNEIAKDLVTGMTQLMEPAIVLVFARAILVIMEEGYILDTIVQFLTNLISGLPGITLALGFYVIQILINFIIPANTGQAATTMPIMTPLADGLGITRQTSVLAYVLGSGFMDSIIPTSGVLMAQLMIGKIPYKTWVRFMLPLMTVWLLIGAVFIVFAYLIGYGPY